MAASRVRKARQWWPRGGPVVLMLTAMSAADPVRVVVADDHPFFRDGVARGLTMSGRVKVVAEVEDGRAALEAIRNERPDVALVDYEMPGIDGLGVVRATV